MARSPVPERRRWEVYSRDSGEVIAVVDNRAEARAIARQIPGVVTREQLERRQAAPRSYRDEHNIPTVAVGRPDSDTPLTQARHPLQQLISRYHLRDRVTFKVRAKWGISNGAPSRKTWLSRTIRIDEVAHRLAQAPPGETMEEAVGRIFDFDHSPEVVYEIVTVRAK